MSQTEAADATVAPKPRQKHWYRMHVGECPVCGRDKSYRERVYGEPPARREDRYRQMPQQETYDHCLER